MTLFTGTCHTAEVSSGWRSGSGQRGRSGAGVLSYLGGRGLATGKGPAPWVPWERKDPMPGLHHPDVLIQCFGDCLGGRILESAWGYLVRSQG